MLCSVCMGRGKFTLCLRQVEITSGPIMPSRLLAGPTNVDADGEGKPKKHRPWYRIAVLSESIQLTHWCLIKFADILWTAEMQSIKKK